MHSSTQAAFYVLATRCLSREAVKEEQQRLVKLLQTPARRIFFRNLVQRWDQVAQPEAVCSTLRKAAQRLHLVIAIERSGTITKGTTLRFPRRGKSKHALRAKF